MPMRSSDDAIRDAIDNDKLRVILVSSKAGIGGDQEEAAYGAGKTTLAMRVSWYWNHYHPILMAKHTFEQIGEDIRSLHEFQHEGSWGPVFANLWAYPHQTLDAVYVTAGKRVEKEQEALEGYRAAHPDDRYLVGFEPTMKEIRAESIIKVGILDDVQRALQRQTGAPRILSQVYGELSKGRPAMPVLIMTGPGVNDLPSRVADMIDYEFIITERGHYVVEFHSSRKNFHNSKRDNTILLPRDEGDFGPLPVGVRLRLSAWRRSQDELSYPTWRNELLKFEKVAQEKRKDEDKPHVQTSLPAVQFKPGMGRQEKDSI